MCRLKGLISVVVMGTTLQACMTVDAFMSPHIGRGSSLGDDPGMQLGIGRTQYVRVESIAPPVKDSSDFVVNPEPKNSRDATMPMIAFDAAFSFAKRFDVGVSTRGVYAFADLVQAPYFTLSLSPSYNKIETQTHAGKGTTKAVSVAMLSQIRGGFGEWLKGSIYAGPRGDRLDVEIESASSKRSGRGNAFSYGGVAGAQIHLLKFLNVDAEAAITCFKTRNSKEFCPYTMQATGNLHF